MKKSLLSIAFAFLCASVFAEAKVYYVDLADGTKITGNPIKEYKKEAAGKANKTMLIYPHVEYQTMSGIGGCFNEIGGVALMSLDEKAREEVMANLFSKDGAYFSICRTAIGSSDFGVSAYSYADTKDDYEMEHFTIEREMTSVIPYIKMALKYNPEMQLFSSPWSPPAWMKQSGEMDKGKDTGAKNTLIKNSKIYKAYAKYFRLYVEKYAEQGITVDRIMVQNETDMNAKYPSNFMSAEEMGDFIIKYLRPEFKKNKTKAEIWAGTFRTAKLNLHGLEYASNKEYVDAVEGIGIQYTGDNYISDINLLSQNKPLMHTESICYKSQNTMAQGRSRFGEVAKYVNRGSENFAYWNMILDEQKKSGWDWKQNSLIVIDRNTKKVTYNPDFAAMAIMGKYIRPGAVRIGAFPGEGSMTFKYEGKTYVFVENTTDKDVIYNITEPGKENAKAAVPAQSIAVIIY